MAKEKKQKISSDPFQVLVDKNADGIVIVDHAGNIQFLNPSAISLFERPETELLGQSFGFPIEGRQISEFSIVRPGGIISVEMSSAKIDWKGKASYLVSLRDVSERKNAFLVQSQMSAIVDYSEDAIFNIDLNGIILSCSKGAENLYGYTPDEIINKPISIFHPPEYLKEIEKKLALLREGKIMNQRETIRFKKDGSRIEVSLTMSVLKDANNNIIGAIEIVRDISKIKTAQRELVSYSKRLEKITEALPGAVFQYRLSADGKVTWPYISRGVSNLWEITTEQLYENPDLMERYTDEDSAEILKVKTEESVRNLTHWKHEFKITTVSGKEKWIYVHSIPEKIDDGSTIWNGVMLDITDRKNAEKDLVLSVDRFKLAIQASNDGIFEWDTKEKVFYSPRYKEILGYSEDEILGTVWEFKSRLHPDDLDRVWTAVMAHLEKRIPYDIEYRLKHKDGEYRWFRARAQAEWDAKTGKAIRLVGSLIDMTEQKKMEKDLQLSLSRFNLAMRASNDGLWEWDTGEKVYYAQRFKELLGYSENEISDRFSEFETRLYPEDIERVKAALKAHFEKRVPYDIEYRLKHKNGQWVPFRARGLAEWDPDTGKPTRMAGSISDLTEQKKMEEQLRQSQKMETVGTLAGGVAHDLNNQLTPICGYLDLSLSRLDPANPVYEYLQTAHLAADRCKEIIQRLMNFSRRSTEGRKNIFLKVSFQELKQFISKLLPANIEIQFDPDQELWPIHGNETELQSIFMNLSVNARDAMPSGGILKIQMANCTAQEAERLKYLRAEPYVHITFTDTGTGMSAETAARIFEPFFTTKPLGQGTGLGLAMVFKIIQEHKGYIGVTTEIGKGTTFNIYIPARPEAISEKKTEGRKEIRAVGSQGQFILFADDEEPIRALGGLFLKHLGFDVLLANDGEEALRIYKEHSKKITGVVMDITMPKMTGRQILKEILGVNSQAKIIVSSGYSAENLEKDFLMEGAKAFLLKPYSLQSFSEILTAVFQMREM